MGLVWQAVGPKGEGAVAGMAVIRGQHLLDVQRAIQSSTHCLDVLHRSMDREACRIVTTRPNFVRDMTARYQSSKRALLYFLFTLTLSFCLFTKFW
jgi:hypothetical protein